MRIEGSHPITGRVQVKARAPGHDFTCGGDGIAGEATVEGERIVSAKAEFPLERLKAGDPLGNRELRKFLDLDRRPVAKGELAEPIALSIAGDRVSGSGKLRLVVEGPTTTVPVRFEGTLPRVRASIDLTFTGLGYKPPKLLFLKVKDELSVELEIEVVASSQAPS